MTNYDLLEKINNQTIREQPNTTEDGIITIKQSGTEYITIIGVTDYYVYMRRYSDFYDHGILTISRKLSEDQTIISYIVNMYNKYIDHEKMIDQEFHNFGEIIRGIIKHCKIKQWLKLDNLNKDFKFFHKDKIITLDIDKYKNVFDVNVSISGETNIFGIVNFQSSDKDELISKITTYLDKI